MKVHSNKFIYIITRLPSDDDEILFVCNGAKIGEELLLRKWHILEKRSLIVNSKGQLGLVVNGKVKMGNDLVDVNGEKLSKEVEKVKINFDASCRVNWSKTGLMKVNRKTLIELVTVLEPAKFRGSCEVLVDNELVPELCFASVI